MEGDGQTIAERRDRGAHPAGGHAGGRDHQELTGRRRDAQDFSVPVAPWGGPVPGLPVDEGAPTSAAKAFAMSLG